MEVRLALNHWQLAIETHNTNFPNTLHDCTDISACDPRRYPHTSVLITSPECTNHSLANGKRKPSKQMGMFDQLPTEAEERSRATMWDVCRFAEYHGYEAIIVENVVDARKWVMWDAWLQAMHLLGYAHKCVYINSMHFWPTPQSRDRMYVVFWRSGNKAPKLDYRPQAHCAKCGAVVNAVQSWKPGRSSGIYRKQYVYCCPKCASVVEPFYFAALNAIDWALPAQRIGDRKRPLKDKTMARIQRGLDKYGSHFLAMKDSAAVDWAHPLSDALTTQVASSSQHAVVHPFLIETQFTHSDSDRSSDITDVMRTQTAQQGRGVVVPHITSYYNMGNGSAITDALPTVVTHDRHGIVVPPFVLSGYTRPSGVMAAVRSIDGPLPTVPGRAVHGIVVPPTAMGNAMPTTPTGSHKYLVMPGAFMVDLQNHTLPTWLWEVVNTVLAGGNHKALVQADAPNIMDCGFRMLQPAEIGKAMAFPDDYVVKGQSREKIKQYGNAVTPPPMAWLARQVIETLA